MTKQTEALIQRQKDWADVARKLVKKGVRTVAGLKEALNDKVGASGSGKTYIYNLAVKGGFNFKEEGVLDARSRPVKLSARTSRKQKIVAEIAFQVVKEKPRYLKSKSNLLKETQVLNDIAFWRKVRHKALIREKEIGLDLTGPRVDYEILLATAKRGGFNIEDERERINSV